MIAFLAALPSFVAALPFMLQLAVQVMGLVESFVTWAKENNAKQWISELEDTMNLLRKAKTPDDKKAAAGKIGDIFRSLG